MRLFLLSLVLLGSCVTSAQQTYVPDNNFEAYLEGNGMGNGIPNDDYVTTANISGVGTLIVWGYNIADLTGIEDFSSLNTLYCFDNQLTTLDLTQNTMLSELRCYSNDLTTLDVSTNTALTVLFCFDNQLNSIDVSSSPWLNELRCFDNNLASLDVTQNPALTLLFCYNNPIGSLNVTQNTQLTDLRCYNNQLNILDVSQNTSLVTLMCYNNNLATLNASQNTQLTLLFCYTNQLSLLNVSNNPALTDLRCYFNQLTSLDVSQCTALITLMCFNNDLTSLDVTQNPALVSLFCQDNELECLLANNGQNINLDCSLNQLTCISVVNPTWAYANAIYDSGISFEVLCLYFIDNDVTQNGTMLTAVQNGATYQWLDCGNNYEAIGSGGTNQTYNPTTSGYYAVEVTLMGGCSGFQVDTSSCHLVDYSSLEELEKGNTELIRITDLMGRETPYKPNVALIYYYSDGTIERVFKIDQ